MLKIRKKIKKEIVFDGTIESAVEVFNLLHKEGLSPTITSITSLTDNVAEISMTCSIYTYVEPVRTNKIKIGDKFIKVEALSDPIDCFHYPEKGEPYELIGFLSLGILAFSGYSEGRKDIQVWSGLYKSITIKCGQYYIPSEHRVLTKEELNKEYEIVGE